MACRNKRRWYLEDTTGTRVLVKDTFREAAWKKKENVIAPSLFSSVRHARKWKDKYGGIVRYYNAKQYQEDIDIPF